MRNDAGSATSPAPLVTAPGATGAVAAEPVQGAVGEPTLLDGGLVADFRRGPTMGMDGAKAAAPPATAPVALTDAGIAPAPVAAPATLPLPAATEPIDTTGATLDDVLRHTKRKADSTTHQEAGNSLDDRIRAHYDSAASRTKKDPLLGEVLGGRFQVLKKIGSGGMGAVYRARQEGMDRDVAVKVLLGELTENDTVLRRFTLEALAVSRLKHPNTIQIFDFGQTPQGNPYIAMELLEGQTLHDLLRSERPLPIRRALRIMGQVASSLAEAHGKGIVHRDLKPENIFLIDVGANHDYVKVLDFGVAKLHDKNLDGKGTLTQAGSIFGTPRYMSPEQCSAQPVDGRSDLYALGVMLFEMITGLPPFQSDQPLMLLLAHVNDPPPSPGSVTDKQVIPAEVEEVVLQLLAKLPENRVQDAEAFARICHDLEIALPAAFDERVGQAEAESLGVRLPSSLTIQTPTERTVRLGALPTPGVQAPALEPVPLAEETPLAKARRGFGLLLLLGTVGGGAVLATVWAVGTPEPEVRVEYKERIVHAAIPDDKVEVGVSTVPPGAYILHAGVNIGSTNGGKITRDKNAPAETWELVRDGYKKRSVVVKFDLSREIQVPLERLDPGVAAQVPPPVLVAPAMPGTPRPRPAAKALPKPEVAVKPELKVEAPKPEAKAAEPVKAKPKDEPIDELK